MTLLNATIVLLEAARCLPETAELRKAIKRMEARLEVLQARQAKAQLRIRRRCIDSWTCPACGWKALSWEQWGPCLRMGNDRGVENIYSFQCGECGEVWINPEFEGTPDEKIIWKGQTVWKGQPSQKETV